MCITRSIVRWGLISGLALGGLTLLVGPQRMAAGLHTVRAKVQCAVDTVVDDPVALRRQLQHLAEEYPDRINEVRTELTEVERQIAEIERDMEISERVVAMTTDDLGSLKRLVDRAEAAQADGERIVKIRFENMKMNLDQAYSEANRILSVREGYQDRLNYDQQQLQFLGEQEARLIEILANLETEYSQFQNQLWQIDKQIDAIERNERLIEMTERQQATLDGYSKFEEVGSLKQLEGKLAELKTIQDAQFQALRDRGIHRDYAKQAESQLDMTEIEITPFDDVDTEATGSDAVAWNGTTVIEINE